MFDAIKRNQSIGFGPVCGIGKHPVFPADNARFDCPFGTVVVDVKIAVIDVANEFWPLS